MKTPSGLDLEAVERFFNAVEIRLHAGAVAYGNRSYARRPGDLLREIEEELLDICGWGFILWTKLQQLKAKTERIPEDENRTPLRNRARRKGGPAAR